MAYYVELIIAAVSILLSLYLVGKRKMGFFKNTGIKFISPYTYLGNSQRLFIGREHLNDSIKRSYDAFPDEKYVGFFNFSQASIAIKDLDLLKQITVKDFDHFVDHTVFDVSVSDPLFYYNLFNLRGDKWRDMRNTLSPAFTGSKMKEMIPFIEQCAATFITFLKEDKRGTQPNQAYKEVELKDLLTRFTNDVIASCAFGIQSDSLNDQNNNFYKNSLYLSQFKGLEITQFAGYFLFPSFMTFFNLKLMNDQVVAYFRKTVSHIMNVRKTSGVIRRDMIHLLMQAIKGSLKEEKTAEVVSDNSGYSTVYEQKSERKISNRIWTEDEIIAQVVIFIFAGFDTVSTMLSFMIFELCTHQDVLQKLQSEVDEYVNDHDGAMATYGDLQKLKYMDMVCSETLRLWPPVGLVDRQCTKAFRLPPTNTNHQGHTIKKDDVIQIPIFPIHRDPKYWPNPEKFDPERFSNENKGSIRPFSYLPFGFGPRSCIGNRFVLMEVKLLIFHLLHHFDLVITPKTVKPIKIRSHVFSLNAKKGLWIGCQPRNNK